MIISCNSCSVGFCPSDLITVPTSLVGILPVPFLSKRLKASLTSDKQNIFKLVAYKICTEIKMDTSNKDTILTTGISQRTTIYRLTG